MNDQELREMVRASIARHAGLQPHEEARLTPGPAHSAFQSDHPSFARLPLRSGDDDGACVIEPSVRCNHCGYCLSYGH